MSFSSEQLIQLVDAGLSAEQIRAVAEIMGQKKRSSSAERMAKKRARDAEVTRHSDVTTASHVTSRDPLPPFDKERSPTPPKEINIPLPQDADDSASEIIENDWPESFLTDLQSVPGLHRAEWQGHTARILVSWRNNGFSYRQDVLPTVTEVAKRLKHQPRSWEYFTGQVSQAFADRTRKIPIPEPQSQKPPQDAWDIAIQQLTGGK